MISFVVLLSCYDLLREEGKELVRVEEEGGVTTEVDLHVLPSPSSTVPPHFTSS